MSDHVHNARQKAELLRGLMPKNYLERQVLEECAARYEAEDRATQPPGDHAMSRLTDDRNDPGINQPTGPGETNEAYLVLSEAERAKGFVRPVRDSYVHASKCGTVTRMARELAETYAREPKFYSHTWCCACRQHCPVEEFVWDRDGQRVGS